MKNPPIPDRVAERALARFVLNEETGCHVSTYSTASHGYAQIGWHEDGRREVITAHRAAWSAVNGPIPDGMTIDHLCKNRRCVNPDHLRLLSNYENARRTHGRDWPLGTCAHGHGPEHTVVRPNGKRVCRPCNERWQEKYKAKKAA